MIMWKWILATAFVASCTIGTSLVGQIFIIGIVGFWASIAAVFLSWAYLLITALYYLEATLSRPPGANIFSITRFYFGSFWGWITAVLWICVSIGGLAFVFPLAPSLIVGMLAQHGITVPVQLITFTFPLIIGLILYLGPHLTMSINLILLASLSLGLLGSYRLGFEQITPQYFKLFQLGFLILVIPVLITAMYYQMIIPTIATFLDNQFKKIRSSIVVGSFISAVIFALWGIAVSPIAGKIGPENLSKVHFKYLNYEELAKVPIVGPWMPFISLLTITTGALVLGTIAVDVLADLFGYELSSRKGVKRVLLLALVVVPSFILSLIPPEYTYLPLVTLIDTAWLFMSGLLPIFWVWARRFREQYTPYTAPGGNTTLIITTAIACFVFYLVGIEIIYQTSI